MKLEDLRRKLSKPRPRPRETPATRETYPTPKWVMGMDVGFEPGKLTVVGGRIAPTGRALALGWGPLIRIKP